MLERIFHRSRINMRNCRFFMILALLAGLVACGRQSREEHYTSVLEGTRTKVNALMGGTIQRVNIAEGDSVRIGEVLAVLDNRELNFQGDQLAATERELDAQENVSRTQINQAQTDLAYVNQRKERTQNLVGEGVLPRQNLDDLLNLESKARSQLTAANQSLELLKAKRAQLAAQKEILSKKLDDSLLRATANGRISTLYYRGGEVIPPLGQLAEIVTLDSMETSIYVGEERLAEIKTGRTLPLKIAGLDQALTGTVIRIADQAEFTPKTVLTPDNRSSMVYAVRIRVPNPQGALKDGMPVDVCLK